MTGVPETSAAFDIERLLVAMRPRLHRYCARMVGSVIDGEDVLQDALDQGGGGAGGRRRNRQSRRLAVPDRAQHRAGFPAPAQPPGGAPLG